MNRRSRPVAFPLLRRELRLLAADVGLGVELVAFLALMLAAGVPLVAGALGSPPTGRVGGDTLLSSLVGLQWLLAGLVAPWALTRLQDRGTGGGLSRWAAQSAASPWRVIGARLVATWVHLLHLLLLPLPLLLIVLAALEASPVVLLGAYFELGSWLLLLAPAVLLCQPAARGFPGRLGLSYLTALLLAVARHLLAARVEGAMVGSLMLAAAGGLALLLLAAGRRRLLFVAT